MTTFVFEAIANKNGKTRVLRGGTLIKSKQGRSGENSRMKVQNVLAGSTVVDGAQTFRTAGDRVA